jgi:hypothetical protein
MTNTQYCIIVSILPRLSDEDLEQLARAVAKLIEERGMSAEALGSAELTRGVHLV